MLTANAAGLKFRIQSLTDILTTQGIGIFTIQETHFQKKGKLHIKDWQMFEAIRKTKGG